MMGDPAPWYIRWLSKPFDYGVSIWNGVARRSRQRFSIRDTYPHHKETIVQLTLKYSKPGETVVFVGAGRGVGPVRVARAERRVIVIEAAAEMVEDMRATRELNELADDELTVIHGVVGGEYDVYGDSNNARKYATSELHGDMLMLDCEGAEKDILPAKQFGTVLVETHPKFNAPTAEIRELMGEDAEQVATNNHDGDYLVRT